MPVGPLASGYAGRKVLITGGAGYLAHGLSAALAGTDCRIVRLYREGGHEPSQLGASVAQIEDVAGDVRRADIWSALIKDVDIVFHLAAQTSVYVANDEPQFDLEENVLPVLHLVEACRKHERRLDLVLAGTATQVGICTPIPADESCPDDPVTVYDIHKLMAERYLRYYSRAGIVRGTTLRLANVFGPGPKVGSADRGILSKMVRMALAGAPLKIFGTGQYLRDYVYIDDVIAAFLMTGLALDRANGEHFLVGSGRGHLFRDAVRMVASRVEAKTGVKVPVLHVESPASLSPIETRNFVADTTRISRLVGWRATVTLEEGIDRTIESFLREAPSCA